MDEIKVDVVEIGGKEYYLIDKITTDKCTYCYFSNKDNKYDVKVLIDGDEEYLPLKNSVEYVKAMDLFYLKYTEK